MLRFRVGVRVRVRAAFGEAVHRVLDLRVPLVVVKQIFFGALVTSWAFACDVFDK